MAGLPLFELPTALLEKIINQLEWKTYFRLQQTCRDMEELAQTNRRIKHLWHKGPFLYSTRGDDDSLRFCLMFDGAAKSVDIASLYGVRFDFISLSPGLEDNQFLEEFCDTLKKYRITAKDADFYSLKNFKPEQYVTLFKVLKPVRAELVSRGSNLFEVLLEVKELEQVAATVNLSDVAKDDLFLIREFLSRFQKVRFLVHDGEMNQYLDFFKKILQFLRHEPLPNLRSFELTGKYYDTTQLPPEEEQLQRFGDFGPRKTNELVNSDPAGEPYQYNFKCALGDSGRSCELVIDCYCAEIHFEPVVEEEQ